MKRCTAILLGLITLLSLSGCTNKKAASYQSKKMHDTSEYINDSIVNYFTQPTDKFKKSDDYYEIVPYIAYESTFYSAQNETKEIRGVMGFTTIGGSIITSGLYDEIELLYTTDEKRAVYICRSFLNEENGKITFTVISTDGKKSLEIESEEYVLASCGNLIIFYSNNRQSSKVVSFSCKLLFTSEEITDSRPLVDVYQYSAGSLIIGLGEDGSKYISRSNRFSGEKEYFRLDENFNILSDFSFEGYEITKCCDLNFILESRSANNSILVNSYGKKVIYSNFESILFDKVNSLFLGVNTNSGYCNVYDKDGKKVKTLTWSSYEDMEFDLLESSVGTSFLVTNGENNEYSWFNLPDGEKIDIDGENNIRLTKYSSENRDYCLGKVGSGTYLIFDYMGNYLNTIKNVKRLCPSFSGKILYLDGNSDLCVPTFDGSGITELSLVEEALEDFMVLSLDRKNFVYAYKSDGETLYNYYSITENSMILSKMTCCRTYKTQDGHFFSFSGSDMVYLYNNNAECILRYNQNRF